MMNPKLEKYAESVHLSGPAVYFQSANPPVPHPPYYYLNVLNDIPKLLNAHSLHAVGIIGTCVRVSMVDSGFFMHPHYLSQNYTIEDIRNIDNIGPPDTLGLVVTADEFGHGTAMAANLLAVARGCTFSFVKCEGVPLNDSFYHSFPVAGFMAAVQYQNPDIITCSWGVLETADRNSVTLEAVDAVSRGIVVLFAAGNKGFKENSGNGKMITHPNIISVGGAYPKESGEFEASNFANSYDSVIYTNPQRHCPDVVGLVGKDPLPAALIMLPTQPDSTLDGMFTGNYPVGDGLQPNDGWVVTSGTSAATPQAAGAASLLLQKYSYLTPMSVKNILENSARDIVGGKSASRDLADLGWDKATGFGLIDCRGAIDFLNKKLFSPYIRSRVEDNGTGSAAVDPRLWSSPDIIVRSEPVDPQRDELGQTVKYRDDLGNKVKRGRDNYIYLRVQNRGTLKGDCTAIVYFTDPGMFSKPADLKKIGQLNIRNLAPGDFKTVGPLIWSENKFRAIRQYCCIIVILDSLGSPFPDLTAIRSSNDLINMVRNSKSAGIGIDVS